MRKSTLFGTVPMLALVVAFAAPAQLSIAAGPAPDLSGYARSADVAASISTAISAATPAPCTTPMPDTLNGTAGSGAPCMARPDSTRPTAVQRVNTTTDASGNFSVTWGRTFASATPVVSVKPVLSAGTKGDCGFSTVSSTTASGSCWTYQTVTVAALGSSVNPVASAAAGVRVMLVGGEPTQ